MPPIFSANSSYLFFDWLPCNGLHCSQSKKFFFSNYPVSPGDQSLAKETQDSGYEIGMSNPLHCDPSAFLISDVDR